MTKHILGSIIAVSCAVCATPSFADRTIDTYPFWDGNITDGWNAVAQSFVVDSNNVLRDYKFGYERSGIPIQFDIFAWDETIGPVGNSLYSTSFTSVAGDNLVNNINLTLSSGSMYAAIVDTGNQVGQGVHWMTNVDGNPEGDASWFNGTWQFFNSGWSTKFMANFTGGGNEYTLSVNMPNGCPGPITLNWSGAGSGQHGLVIGNQLGSFTIPPSQPCGGTVLGIAGSVMLVDPPGIFSTQGGTGSINGNIQSNVVCGRYLQLVKGGSCDTSNPALID